MGELSVLWLRNHNNPSCSLWPIKCSTVYCIYICVLPFLMKLKLSLDSTILDLGIQEYSARSDSRQFFFRNAIDSWVMKVYPMNKSQRPYKDLKFFPTSGAHCLSNTGRMSNFEWLTQCTMRIARWVSDGFCTWSARPQRNSDPESNDHDQRQRQGPI